MAEPARIPEMHSLISSAVAATLTPDFVEKEIKARVEKLISETINQALRTYSDIGKLIEAAVTEALKVERLDLPSYGHIVTKMLKAQIEATVAPIVAGRLAADMDELLCLAPKEMKLSAIAEEMVKSHHHEGSWGDVITVIVEHNEYGSAWVYLDDWRHFEEREKNSCDHRLLVGKDGTISSATSSGKTLSDTRHVGSAYGLEQKIRAWVACGTKIILDEDYVVTSIGD